PLQVQRSWPANGELSDAKVTIRNGTDAAGSLTDADLARPLELYRPFLTAAELGKLISGTPSELFDAINAILGLEALTDADRRLMAAARRYESAIRDRRAARVSLRAEFAALEDDRARRAAALLSDTEPDLDQLEAILAEPLDGGPEPAVNLCQRLAALTIAEPEEVTRLAG